MRDGVTGVPVRVETQVADGSAGVSPRQDLKLILGPAMEILDANPAAATLWGLTHTELAGLDFPNCFENSQVARNLYALALKNGKAQGCFLELKQPAGTVAHLLCRAMLLRADGSQVLVTADDFTDRKSLAAAFFESQERFRIAFEFTTVGIGMVDLDGNIFEANQPLAEIFGYTREELEKMNLFDIWIPDERVEALAEFKAAGKGGQARTVFERRYLNKKGHVLIAEVTRGLARSQTGNPMYFIITFRDITESKRLLTLLEEQAATDALTGAMNRIGVEERATFELRRSDRYGDKICLIMIDLDHFKAINDAHGHGGGDRVLRGFCDLARNCLRSTDLLGRWGGEEFVALLPETGINGAYLLSERLRATLECFRFDCGIKVTASIGVAAYREGEDLATLVGRADLCMYRAKQSGRNRIVLDSGDVEREAAGKHSVPELVNLRWRASYSSGEPLIDAEHQELFRLTNLILATVSVRDSHAERLALVHDLVAHVQVHFAHEEKLLHAAGYPLVAAHAEIHRQLESRALELACRFERRGQSPSDMLGFLLHDVVAQHMLQEDQRFFPWLKESRP